MKKYLLIFFLFTFLSGCMDRAIDKRNLRICNKSIGMIYFFISKNDVYTNPYQDYSEEVLNANNCIRQDTSAFYIDKPINWDEFIKNCKDGKMRVFIVSKDSIDKYGLKIVIFKSIFTKKYLVDINNLNKTDWSIIYKDK